MISKEDLATQFPKTSIDMFFDTFSFKPGSINNTFRYPTDTNELDTKFLMQLGNDGYYAIEVIRLFQTLSAALLQIILNGKYDKIYYKHRDQIAQKRTTELLRKVFPTIYERAYYGYDVPMEFETDLLIPYKKTLLICEIKAAKLRDPLHTIGNIEKIKSDFRDSIQQAYLQALRTKEYILSKPNAQFVSKQGKPLYSFENDGLDDFVLMIVTAESFRSLATNLSFLLDKKQNDPYPLAISLFDLELLVTK